MSDSVEHHMEIAFRPGVFIVRFRSVVASVITSGDPAMT